MPPARPVRTDLSTQSQPQTWPPGPPTEPGADESWVAREVDAMAEAWSRGLRVLAGEIIDRHPGIADEAAVRLIYEEVNLRREAGEDVPTTEVVVRYARWKDELEVLLGCDRLLRPLAHVAELPEVGEHLGPFFLRAELGRGASGKTYLASEPTLADRAVVLKVISDDQEEHLSLARLQHTNIIPLFSEHTFPERGLRALCMPYLGGASLARILEALATIPPSDRRGRDIIHVLDRLQAAGSEPTTLDRPYRRQIEKISYVEAICWIGTRLADALQEAHAHGLVHMDVKPSNVLIAADGSPMLLDFHLACRPIGAGERFPDRIGGTTGWMAPEHRAALDAVATGEPIPEAVDHRADVYALGLLLRESLGGPRAASANDVESPLRRRNPGVSVGLEDILAKCLAERPSGRYPNAAALAEDLRRHLDHRPLGGVPNRSLSERLKKWRRRRGPLVTGRTAAIAAIVLFAVAVGAWTLAKWTLAEQSNQAARADLQEGRALCSKGRYADAEFALRRGLDRAAMLPLGSGLAGALNEQLRVAHRGQRAEALHNLAEQVRFRYGIEPPHESEADALLRTVRTIWDDRDLLLVRDPAPAVRDAGLDDQIRSDLLELVTLWAELRTRLAPPDESRATNQEALVILEEARAACGPSFSLDRLQRTLSHALGRDESPARAEPVPRSPHDHYEFGRSLLRQGRYQAAAEQFRLSLDRRPQDFWPNFYLGLCEYRLKDYRAAMTAFSIGNALAHGDAECYFNRAMAADALEQRDQALRDYTRALEQDDRLTAARINRGILSYKAGRFAEAIADFRQALATTSDPKTIGRIHYNLALAHQARGDRALAIASANQAVASGAEEARKLLERLRNER